MRIEFYKLRKDPAAFDVGARWDAIIKTPLEDRNRQRDTDFIRPETHVEGAFCFD